MALLIPEQSRARTATLQGDLMGNCNTLAQRARLAGMSVAALALAVLPLSQSHATSILNAQDQAALAKAKATHWQRITVLNHAATTVQVTFDERPRNDVAACGGACSPSGTVSIVEAGQSFSNTIDSTHFIGILSVQGNATSNNGTCFVNQEPDGGLSSYTVTVTGSLFGIKCTVATTN